ncbi:Hypothetical predicted protein [Xyrichtys novacula]|uniref:Uncharacterized protein n=1 Tax=Xyrichtys novacula TaxID=13765 RepID=A0AAV1FIN1_XYRNO|nr:Hypothetical predicted protein [Xyrichtys novacula]
MSHTQNNIKSFTEHKNSPTETSVVKGDPLRPTLADVRARDRTSSRGTTTGGRAGVTPPHGGSHHSKQGASHGGPTTSPGPAESNYAHNNIYIRDILLTLNPECLAKCVGTRPPSTRAKVYTH